MTNSVQLIHALIWDGYDSHERPLHVGVRVLYSPTRNARTIDLSGYVVYPGLVNAHDHLELNHYPRTRFRDVYDNAHEWGEDVNQRLNEMPFRELRAYPLRDRLFIGGLKNLLSGVTTVAHHNPLHRELRNTQFPVRVLQRYGWSHSLHFDTEIQIYESFQRCGAKTPWFIHIAEGTDSAAEGELTHLNALGCLHDNTVLIHGVGIQEEWFLDHPSKLIWCPSTNLYLLGQTLTEDVLYSTKKIALGSDSRLTADGDLLDELCAASSIVNMTDERALRLVTSDAADVIGMDHVGHLRPGADGDWIVTAAGTNGIGALRSAHRTDLLLVVHEGIPVIGQEDLMGHFPHIPTVAAILDGIPRRINEGLARRIVQSSLKEPGLELDEEALRPRRAVWHLRWFRSQSHE